MARLEFTWHLHRLLLSWLSVCLSIPTETIDKKLVSNTGRGPRETTISWDITRIREHTALARAVRRLFFRNETLSDDDLVAKMDIDGALARCLRSEASQDLAPAIGRMKQVLGPQGVKDCARGAHHFYCEALMDVLEPWPFERPSHCAEPPPTEALLYWHVERDMRICYVIFMMGEVSAIQQFLSHRAPHDCAVIHVDLRWKKAYADMAAWAENQSCITVESRWQVLRPGFSAGAALLDMFEVAVESPKWEFAIFLSGSHYWMRPRSELGKFLFYHQVNFVSTDESTIQIDYREAVAPHYELQYECANKTWRICRDEKQDTILLPRLGHPNLTAVFGQPFVTVTREFTEWLVRSRRVRGSPAWVVLRHTMRTFGSVEQMIGSLLLNSPWCHTVNTRYDLTYALSAAGDQELQWNSSKEGLEFNALSASILDENDLQSIRMTRWHGWSAYQVTHGADGPPPPLVKALGIYRVASDEERAWMKCKDRCWEALSLYNCSDASVVFHAFARKVDDGLRARLDEDAQEPAARWIQVEWSLAQRVWELWAGTECPIANMSSSLVTHRQICDPREDSMPCPLDLRIELPSCPNATVFVKERVAIGVGRISAFQVGADWTGALHSLNKSSVVSMAETEISVVFYLSVKRRYDMINPGKVRILILDNTGNGLIHEGIGDLCVLPKRAVASVRNMDRLRPGTHTAILEYVTGPEELDRALVPENILARRTFFIYKDENELTKDLLFHYFDITVLSHSEPVE